MKPLKKLMLCALFCTALSTAFAGMPKPKNIVVPEVTTYLVRAKAVTKQNQVTFYNLRISLSRVPIIGGYNNTAYFEILEDNTNYVITTSSQVTVTMTLRTSNLTSVTKVATIPTGSNISNVISFTSVDYLDIPQDVLYADWPQSYNGYPVNINWREI